MRSCLMQFAWLAILLHASTAGAESDWFRWRGPHQNGHSTETGLPVSWTAGDVTWKTALPGRGQSTPVLWGERIYLTSSLNDGRERLVLCLDRTDGRILWQRTAWTGEPEKIHKMNSWATPSCVTDGERVYAFFGRGGGLHCYTAEGEHVWSRDLGTFESPWGTASCPILVDDLVIQACDADVNASIAGLNKFTGEIVWQTRRDDKRGWSTPIVIEANGRQEVVVNGDTGVRAYDPKTGRELWFCKSFRGRGTPTVTEAGGLLHVVCGLAADVYAIRPGGDGDVTESHMAWHTKRGGGRDLPSPLVLDGRMLVMNMQGIVAAYASDGGAELGKTRVGGNFSASPVSWNGLAFFVEESGDVVAISPEDSPKVQFRNSISPPEGEIFRASLVPSQGQLFLRSDRTLYCIGSRTPRS